MQSNTSMTYKEELLKYLKDKEYRDAFVSSHIDNGIPFQIKTMRDNRKMTQEELGELAEMKQAAISRLENPNYGSFTLKTLKGIASAFDVALIVRFIPFSDLVKWDLDLSSETLNVLSFNEDPYFKGQPQKISNLSLISSQQSAQSESVLNLCSKKTKRNISSFNQTQSQNQNIYAEMR